MSGSDVVTVRVPFRTVRRGGRKRIVVPEGTSLASSRPAEPEVDTVLLKAMVRAWRWRREIEEGRATSVVDIAERSRLTASFVCRILALTTLAPDMVEDVLDGRATSELCLTRLSVSLPSLWEHQRGCGSA